MKQCIKNICVTAFLLLHTFFCMAQAPTLTRAEYYIDKDPGYGKGITLSLASQPKISFNFDMTKLGYGPHVVGVRTMDANGAWSLDNKWIFIKQPAVTLTPVPVITKMEYYVDKDPGFGKGTAITITPGEKQISGASFTLDLTKVHSGVHDIGMRTLDANGAWSLDNKWVFRGGSSLPLTLLSFAAEVFKIDEAQLLWTTVTEVNTKQFIIQHSINGSSFDSIGVVAAAGNSTAQLNYTFIDVAPFTGINYYRLKMQDLNGEFTYSSVVPVLINTGAAKGLSVYPNPATGSVTLAFTSAAAAKYTIHLTDLLGREIEQVSGVSSAGINTIQLDVHGYATGTYIITLTDEEHGRQSLKLNKF